MILVWEDAMEEGIATHSIFLAWRIPWTEESGRLQPTRLLYPWKFSGKTTGVGCHFLLQGIFPTQGSNLGLLHCRQFLYPLSHLGSLILCCCSSVTKLCLTLCDPVDCSSPGSSIHGILQARILEWVAISFSRGSFQPRDRTWVSCIAVRFFTN